MRTIGRAKRIISTGTRQEDEGVRKARNTGCKGRDGGCEPAYVYTLCITLCIISMYTIIRNRLREAASLTSFLGL